jgi:hypothetical protein
MGRILPIALAVVTKVPAALLSKMGYNKEESKTRILTRMELIPARVVFDSVSN